VVCIPGKFREAQAENLLNHILLKKNSEKLLLLSLSPSLLLDIVIIISILLLLLLLLGLLMSVSFLYKSNCSPSLYHLFVFNYFLLYFILFSILVLACN
jgi:hypothetical protein